jgi:NADP-dependent 3-hydroxy acid dehydrogenase YdfG
VLGWTVLIGGRDADRGKKTAAEVGGQPLLLDVTDEQASSQRPHRWQISMSS